MKITNTTLTVICALTMAGCSFHKSPYPMYEGSVTLSKTAVFSAFDTAQTKFFDARITHVDGKETSCALAGCPYWVRVLPGDHTFRIVYKFNFGMNAGIIGNLAATTTLDLQDMKPLHVYETKYEEAGTKVYFRVKDLGANPSYGLTIGNALSKEFSSVKFDESK